MDIGKAASAEADALNALWTADADPVWTLESDGGTAGSRFS